jgi:hypothetical protein
VGEKSVRVLANLKRKEERRRKKEEIAIRGEAEYCVKKIIKIQTKQDIEYCVRRIIKIQTKQNIFYEIYINQVMMISVKRTHSIQYSTPTLYIYIYIL